MFSNCFEYNQPASNEANAGLRLQSFFVNEAQKLGLEVPISKPIIPPEPTKKSHIWWSPFLIRETLWSHGLQFLFSEKLFSCWTESPTATHPRKAISPAVF